MELRSQNQNSFNSKIAKNSSWLPTITQTVSLDNYHLFTLTADRNNSTFSNWVNGQIKTNAVHDPIGIWEKQKITLMGNRAATPETIGGKVAEVICVRSAS